MKVLFKITFPVARFNELARQGTAGQKLGAILDATKPESIYFTSSRIMQVSEGVKIRFARRCNATYSTVIPDFYTHKCRTEVLPPTSNFPYKSRDPEDLQLIWTQNFLIST